MENVLAEDREGPFIFGLNVTEADIRLCVSFSDYYFTAIS